MPSSSGKGTVPWKKAQPRKAFGAALESYQLSVISRQGRGCGVGRGRGVGVGLGVGLTGGVGVAEGVTVGVGLGAPQGLTGQLKISVEAIGVTLAS